MFDIYTDGFRMLWAYEEFRLFFELLRLALLVTVGVILIAVLLHALFMFGYNTPLYRKRSPRPGWTKRLFMSALVLTALLSGLYFLTGTWAETVT